MDRAWHYAILGIGAIGTMLALLSLLIAPLNWAEISRMGWPPALLLSIAIISGIVQWVVFQRRQFRTAVRLFFVTFGTWSAGAAWHLNDVLTQLHCREQPCVIVLQPVPRS